MALMGAMLAVAPRTTRARLQEPVQVRPAAPYDAKLVVLPVHSVEPFMTYGLVAAQLRQIPAVLLLRAQRWAAVRFSILIDNIEMAKGGIS